MPDSHICAKTLAHHERQKTLCSRLEEIADGLPGSINLQECLVLARDIYPAVRLAHEFEEIEFFPRLQQRGGQERVADGIERLRYEHWEDEDYAEEISVTLNRLWRGEPIGNIEKVSWLLRGFFSGVRRHIAYEADHLLPMLLVNTKTRTSA